MSEKERADAIYALAASWASIDGKLAAFGKEREGYMYEAGEMLTRLERRGFTIARLASPVRPIPQAQE